MESRKIARFRFVGQSNIEGNIVDDPGNLRFDQTMDIVLSAGSDEENHTALVVHLKTVIPLLPPPTLFMTSKPLNYFA